MSDTTDTARKLYAEYAILEEYDRTRSRLGHDYGSGQRAAELMRRRRSLRMIGLDVELANEPHPTKEELAAAFERVGRAKVRRAESETYRKGTPATQRTLRAWAMVERYFTGARDAQLEDELAKAERVKRRLVKPPATTEEAISGIIQRGDGGSAIRRAIERSNEAKRDGELREIVSKLAHGESAEPYSDGDLASARLFTGGASGARLAIDRELARRSAIGRQAADVTSSRYGKLAGNDYTTGPDRDESPTDPYTGAELDL